MCFSSRLLRLIKYTIVEVKDPDNFESQPVREGRKQFIREEKFRLEHPGGRLVLGAGQTRLDKETYV